MSQTPNGTSPGNCSAATTLGQVIPSHLRDTSSHLYGGIQEPSVYSLTRSEDVYLEGLEIIRLYYKRHGIKIKVIRSDDFTTFKSRKVRAYYAKYGMYRETIQQCTDQYSCEQTRGTEHSSTGSRYTTTCHDQPTNTHQTLSWTTTIKSMPSINTDLPSEISYATVPID